MLQRANRVVQLRSRRLAPSGPTSDINHPCIDKGRLLLSALKGSLWLIDRRY
jgi:hypothetical protein